MLSKLITQPNIDSRNVKPPLGIRKLIGINPIKTIKMKHW